MNDDRNIRSREKKTIILKGPLTIQRIGELKDTFSESITSDMEIVIDQTNCEEFDFSYLQLLYSVYTTLRDKNLNISIISNNSSLFEKLYIESGFGLTAIASILPNAKESIEVIA
jgi:anti-anti-sigma regulatory factor